MHLHRTAREAAQIAEAAKQEKIQKTIDRFVFSTLLSL
jgi:hypothetical protein